jgi:hypothetical protein
MGYCDSFAKRRLELTGPESVETLEHIQGYLGDGTNWTQGMYQNAEGARCLVGAAYHVRVSSLDNVPHFLRQAIAEVAPGVTRIEDFNDGCHTFAEVAAVIERARQLAAQSAARALPRPAPALRALPAPAQAEPEILPPERQALPQPAPVVVRNPRPARVRRRPSLASWIMD